MKRGRRIKEKIFTSLHREKKGGASEGEQSPQKHLHKLKLKEGLRGKL